MNYLRDDGAPPATPTPEQLARMICSTITKVERLTMDTGCCLDGDTINFWDGARFLGPYQMTITRPDGHLNFVPDRWAMGVTLGGRQYRVIVEPLPE